MTRPTPAETKLLICVWHPFTLWRPPADVGIGVKRAFPEMKVVHLTTYDHIHDELPDTDIFVGYSLKPEQFTAAKKLKWIHSTAAGVGQLMYPEVRASSVVLTNASGVHSVPMAEHILGMLIALARRFPSAFRHQMNSHWGQQEIWNDQLRPRELQGQTLLFVGFGAIGREVAKRVRPLGMKIWAVTRSGQGDPALADRYLPAAQLEEVLHQADYVILAAPETPETHHLMNAQRLAAMKPTAFLINVARGTLIDEAALIDTLRRRSIAGAALDVTQREPLPSDSPLWSLDNCFITPHISAVSEFLWDRQTGLLLENLARWFGGRELINRVDLARGY
ncbi:MAG: D-2-hydroxyacid dehydrogenase [Acidobacteria bacterium]|nr:D-2-hydroxyacid dehydrogenase [Acidobacteriota bacterium]